MSDPDVHPTRPVSAAPPLGKRRYPLVLLAIFAVVFALSAIKPWDLANWAMENALSAAFVVLLWFTRKRLPLSNLSYTLIFLFLVLHTVGSHYSYSRVPFGLALSEMMGWQRNHYDRIVHFAFGLLLAYPARELFLRVVGVRGFWGYYLPLDVMMSFSMLYELIEWGAASAFGGDLGMAYLGTQGDEWDAHKDMALAALGALIAMGITAWINWKLDRRFGAEVQESLRVKNKTPLGEVRLSELMQNRGK